MCHTDSFGVINNDANVKIGQSVLIFGIGGVGLNIAQAAKMVSANPIIGVDINKKVKYGKKFGLTHGVISNHNLKQNILKITGKIGIDVCIDTTGISNVIETAYNFTHKDGKTILVGVPSKKSKFILCHCIFKKILKGSHGGSAVPDLEIPRYINLIKRKK